MARDQSITATAERYVEQWGCPEPTVEVGVLARVLPDQLGRFHAMKVDYFRVYRGSRPLRAPVVTRPDFIIESRRVLNDFGSLGEIVLESGYEGWSVTLFRTINYKFVPTAVTYYYGC